MLVSFGKPKLVTYAANKICTAYGECAVAERTATDENPIKTVTTHAPRYVN